MSAVRFGVFAPDSPTAVGVFHGLFAAKGLQVELARVTSSTAQFEDLAAGGYDLVQTAIDNVANYSLNDGNALGHRLDVAALAPMDHGMNLTLVARPGASFGDVRGGTLSVDSPTSGFAYIAYSLLESAGLQRGTDYTVVSHGGVRERFARITSGEADVTLLSNGLETVALAQGLARLGDTFDVAAEYQGSVVAGLRSTAIGRAPLVRDFLDAYRAARQIALDPARRADTVAAIAAVREMDPDAAGAVLDGELQRGGLVRDDAFDSRAVRGALELRARQGGFEQDLDLDLLSAAGSPLLAAP